MTRTLLVLVIVLGVVGGAAALTSRPPISLEQLVNSDPDVALKASSWVQDNPLAAEPLLVEGMSHPSPRVRALCAHHLWTLRSTVAVPLFIAALADTEVSVRLQAALGLRWMRSWPSSEAILRVAEDERQPAAIREALLLGMGARGEAGARPLCTRLARDRSQPKGVRTAAVTSLGEVSFGHAECFDALVSLAGDREEDECLRMEILWSAAESRDPRCLEFLIKTTGDPAEAPRVRAGAARALGHLGDTRSLAVLQKWLDDARTPVALRVNALLALLELGATPTPPAGLIMQALKDDAWYVRESAVAAIIRLEDVDMIPILDDLSKHEKNTCVAGHMSHAVCRLKGVGEQEER